jgi:hypothetical protein
MWQRQYLCFIYPSGHVITGDLNIIQHESIRKVISHGPKFKEPQHIIWRHNFKIIMDAVEDYAKYSTKHTHRAKDRE